MIFRNRVVKSFVLRVREKLLDFDLHRKCDVIQAATALSFGNRVDIRRHQNAVVERLEPHVEAQHRTIADAHHGVPEAFGYDDIDFALTRLAGAMHEVEDRDVVWVVSHVRHEGRVYAGSLGSRSPRSRPGSLQRADDAASALPYRTEFGSTLPRGRRGNNSARVTARPPARCGFPADWSPAPAYRPLRVPRTTPQGCGGETGTWMQQQQHPRAHKSAEGRNYYRRRVRRVRLLHPQGAVSTAAGHHRAPGTATGSYSVASTAVNASS